MLIKVPVFFLQSIESFLKVALLKVVHKVFWKKLDHKLMREFDFNDLRNNLLFFNENLIDFLLAYEQIGIIHISSVLLIHFLNTISIQSNVEVLLDDFIDIEPKLSYFNVAWHAPLAELHLLNFAVLVVKLLKQPKLGYSLLK